jgi:hypothetical protein
MIGIGDKIDGRWFVTLAPERFEGGALMELRDAQGEVRWGQLLSARPLSPEQQEALRQGLGQLPPLPCFLRPEGLVVHRSGVAVAVLPEAPPQGLSTRLAGLETGGSEARRVETLRTLLGWFVPLVKSLGTLHALNLVHGTIGLPRLHLVRVGDGDVLALSGFGLGDASGRVGLRAPPRPRDDLGAVVLALAECLDATRCAPDTASLPRWELLKRCVRGGDHPALESAASLVTALESLHVPPAARKVAPLDPRLLAPPGGTPMGGSPAAPSPTAPTSTFTAAGFQAPPMTVPPPPEKARTRRLALLGGVGAVAVLAAVAASQLLGGDTPTGSSQGTEGRTVLAANSSRCAAEPTALPVSAPVTALSGACLRGDAPAVAAVALVGESAVMATRPTTLGAAFSRSLSTVTEGVRHLGTVLEADDGGLWLAWRPMADVAFGVVRMLPTQQRLAVPTEGWSDAPLEGASLLHAAAAEAWVASTLRAPEGGEGSAVVIAQLDAAPTSPAPFTVFAVARGTLLSVIPGDPATLLVQTREPDGRLTVQAHIVPLRTLSGITESPIAAEAYLAAAAPPLAPGDAAAGDAAVGDGGAALAASGRRVRPLSLQSAIRSTAWTTTAAHLRAAPLGVSLGADARAFLVTAAPAADAPGEVSALVLPPRGAPSVWPVAAGGSGLALHARPDGVSLLASVRLGDRLGVFTTTVDGVTQRLQTVAPFPGSAVSVACGGGEFVVGARDGAEPSLLVLRAPCGMHTPR